MGRRNRPETVKRQAVLMTATGHRINRAPGLADRYEACLVGAAYSPHRHDTYTLGLTLSGVQCFDYRGSTRHALPGDAVILHPDELHDGRAGTEIGFRYRAINLAARDVQAILGGRPLPFIDGGITQHRGLKKALRACLGDFSGPPETGETHDMVFDLVDALEEAAGQARGQDRPDYRAAQIARDVIDSHIEEGISLEELATLSGTDRFALSRSFRAFYGTSPHRYLTQRRLDRACALMAAGEPSAQAAAMSGFADQSHFIRHFRKTHGMTPRGWMTTRTNVQ
tara:strand:+ start:9241 stop:10089 length:849 start_codon:yes stop_codon:yes gene_type:complete